MREDVTADRVDNWAIDRAELNAFQAYMNRTRIDGAAYTTIIVVTQQL